MKDYSFTERLGHTCIYLVSKAKNISLEESSYLCNKKIEAVDMEFFKYIINLLDKHFEKTKLRTDTDDTEAPKIN